MVVVGKGLKTIFTFAFRVFVYLEEKDNATIDYINSFSRKSKRAMKRIRFGMDLAALVHR